MLPSEFTPDHYIVEVVSYRHSRAEDYTSFWMIGPFATEEEAKDWAVDYEGRAPDHIEALVHTVYKR
jgi:hypothetical protein